MLNWPATSSRSVLRRQATPTKALGCAHAQGECIECARIERWSASGDARCLTTLARVAEVMVSSSASTPSAARRGRPLSAPGMVCITPKVCYLSDPSHHRRAIMNEQAKSNHPLPIDDRPDARRVGRDPDPGADRQDPPYPDLSGAPLLLGRAHPLVPSHPGARGCRQRVRSGALRGGGQSPGSSGSYFQILRAPRLRPSAEEQEILCNL